MTPSQKEMLNQLKKNPELSEVFIYQICVYALNLHLMKIVYLLILKVLVYYQLLRDEQADSAELRKELKILEDLSWCIIPFQPIIWKMHLPSEFGNTATKQLAIYFRGVVIYGSKRNSTPGTTPSRSRSSSNRGRPLKTRRWRSRLWPRSATTWRCIKQVINKTVITILIIALMRLYQASVMYKDRHIKILTAELQQLKVLPALNHDNNHNHNHIQIMITIIIVIIINIWR